MCKRRATPFSPHPIQPLGVDPPSPPPVSSPPHPAAASPPRPPRVRSPPTAPPGLSPPHLHALLLLFQTLQQVAARRANIAGARGGRALRCGAPPRAHPAPASPLPAAASARCLSPHEQRPLGQPFISVLQSPGLPRWRGFCAERPTDVDFLCPDGVRSLTGTMCLGVVRSRHVPHGAGRREKRRAGVDGARWGGLGGG
uniref:Pollen-specific leucine-rich repeat extensin-like protein 4 n=1 Tax=Castor canadensis TaxID=51338 RepID=A0A8B7TR81_CASCN|nr:pollen-specific leucine-rich repeat extensin-like protein 4 [Castor canadensis]